MGRCATPVRWSRTAFLKRAAAGLLAATAFELRPAAAETPGEEPRRSTWRGKRNSGIGRWVVVTMGNLSRNRYWGESDEKVVRSTLCTCTLIQGADFRLLVDPSLANPEEMARELERRTGLKLIDITHVF